MKPILVLLALLLWMPIVWATDPPAPGDLVLHQMFPNGDVEWVEILSKAEEPKLLENFSLHDATGHFYDLPEQTIEPGEVLRLSGWSAKLNNSGDDLFLFDGSDQLFDEVHYGSWDRDVICIVVDQTCTTEEDSPPDPEPEIPPGARFPEIGEVLLHSCMPNADTEWVEIRSKASEDLWLSGFTLADANGVFHTIPDQVLAPGETLHLEGWGSKLNNTGDELSLLDAEGSVYDRMSYGAWGRDLLCTIENGRCLEEDVPEEPEPEVIPDLPLLRSGEAGITALVSNADTEWVEITSQIEEERLLYQYTLEDEKGKIYEIPLTVLAPGETLRLSGWSSKLNNTGDSVRFLDAERRVLDSVSFPALDKHIVCIVEESTCTEASLQSSKKEKNTRPKLLKRPSEHFSVHADDVEIVFSKVLFSGSEEDLIELECRQCDTDLAGLRIGDDTEQLEFPKGSTVPSGATILVHVSKEKQDPFVDEAGVWHFWARKSGLTATDETLFLLDSRGNVEDALCIANQNEKWSPGEEEDVSILMRKGAWRGEHPLDEADCVDSSLANRGDVLVFTGREEELSKHSYFWSSDVTFGESVQDIPLRADQMRLELAAFRVSEDYVFVIMQNLGSRRLPMSALFFEGETFGRGVVLPGETEFFWVETESETLLFTDLWGDEVMSAEVQTPTLKEASGDLVLSEVLANPEGVDGDREWLELQCLAETCPLNAIVLFVGEELVLFDDDELEQGEFLLLEDVSLRNSDLELQLLDMEQQTEQYLLIEKAEQGQSWARTSEHSWEWTALLTPEKPNLFSADLADQDADGLLDVQEYELGLSPYDADRPHNIERTLSSAWDIQIRQEGAALVFEGKLFPQLRAVLHLGGESTPVTTDAEGRFSLALFPDLEPGSYDFSLSIYQAERVLANVYQETLSVEHNPHDLFPEGLVFSLVLPNPTGTDKGQERIFLKNTVDHPIALHHLVLVIDEKSHPLPKRILEPGETWVWHEPPTLKNTNNTLILRFSQGPVIDEVTWKSAKQGQWFGHDAPIYPEKTSKKSSKSTKKREPWRPDTPGPIVRSGQAEIIAFVGRLLLYQDAQGQVFFSWFGDDFELQMLRRFLHPGQEVELEVQGGRILHVLPQLPEHSTATTTAKYLSSDLLLGMGFLTLLFLLLVLGLQKAWEIRTSVQRA